MSNKELTVTYQCDGCNCREEISFDFGDHDCLHKDRLAMLRGKGWQRDDQKDLCPKCGVKLQEELQMLKLRLLELIKVAASMQQWSAGPNLSTAAEAEKEARLYAGTWVVPLLESLLAFERGELWPHQLRDIVHREARYQQASTPCSVT